MKVLLILADMPSRSPYLVYYTKIFERCGIEYDVCCWNQRGENYKLPDNYFVYDMRCHSWIISRLRGYNQYRHFVLRHGFKKYDRVVVFTVAIACFLGCELVKGFRCRYIFDIRDYSDILKIPGMKNRFKAVLRNSFTNSISSVGFKEWLPLDCGYILSHNVQLEICKTSMNINESKSSDVIKILTIGAIRDFESNRRILDGLGNNTRFLLQFSGASETALALQRYAEHKGIRNACFTGEYKKVKDLGMVQDCNYINILLPRNMISDYLMSNRFYLSVLCRKPMIVNEGCTQAFYVKKYGLGIVVNEGDNLENKILEYERTFDKTRYNDGCEYFLKKVIADEKCFEERIKEFLK